VINFPDRSPRFAGGMPQSEALHDAEVTERALREAARKLRCRATSMPGWAECRADTARWLEMLADEARLGR
jgi:hypothetical protein